MTVSCCFLYFFCW